ncbi:vacuolar protein sorting-associated protein 51 [Carex littledalei]|uniref:Vacuolar protein sorting-associated protein 51 homolog n=1 Tax=Carex littledalei TaxID=544730 RepID=A0A833RGF3_9POAL|nr:vacuolar protein sorting-associated protein 51 [Carex littledalei]
MQPSHPSNPRPALQKPSHPSKNLALLPRYALPGSGYRVAASPRLAASASAEHPSKNPALLPHPAQLTKSGYRVAASPRAPELPSTRAKTPPCCLTPLSQQNQEQSVIPKITEEIAASFSGGGVRAYEYGPAFIPGEICRLFRSAGEKLLLLYINMKTRKISVLLKKRFTTPNWIKHKEPREVHMFVDLLLQELEGVGIEVKQILPCVVKRHRHSDSAGTASTNSSRSQH